MSTSKTNVLNNKKPSIVIFDLDYTLWPFWVDTHYSPPFKKGSKGDIVDSAGSKISAYKETTEVLDSLHKDGYQLAVASRTSEIKGAKQLIKLFGWEKYFSNMQIFPGCKVTHINNIRKDLQIPLNEMIFFDDEDRNIKDLEKHGVVSILVKNGISKNVIQEGIERFANLRRKE